MLAISSLPRQRLHTYLLAGALFISSAAAEADVTGRYAEKGGSEIIVQVNEQGLARIGGGDEPGYTLFTAEDAFIVSILNGSPMVIRWSDMMTVMDERARQILGELATSPENEEHAATEAIQLFRESGRAEIGGWSGIRYTPVADPESENSEFIVSQDPRLAPLGLAWSRFFMRNPTFGRMITGKPGPLSRQLAEMTKDRGPLQLGAIVLKDVSFEDLPPAAFDLPTEPLSQARVREYLKSRRDQNPR